MITIIAARFCRACLAGANQTKALAFIICLMGGVQHTLATSYTVTGDVDLISEFGDSNFGGFSHQSQPVQTSDSFGVDTTSDSPGFKRLVGNVYSDAGYGAAHMSLDSSYQRNYGMGGSFQYIQASGSAVVMITDLIITGPTAVSTHVNLNLDGTLDCGSGAAGVFAESNLSASLQVGNTVVDQGNFGKSSNDGGAPIGSGSGWLANFTGNNALKSSAVTVAVNTPITVRFVLGLNVISGMNGTASGLASSVAYFDNTLSFATDRPVFDLPAGYTANSVSAGIVNNQFIPVPEPSTTAMVVIGAMVALFITGRRRSKECLKTS